MAWELTDAGRMGAPATFFKISTLVLATSVDCAGLKIEWVRSLCILQTYYRRISVQKLIVRMILAWAPGLQVASNL